MQGVRQIKIDALRARIARLENRPPLAPLRGGGGLDLLEAQSGSLYEIFADEQRHGGAALGFALGVARRLLNASRPALVIVQMIGETQEMGLPYGAGLQSFGIDPAMVVLVRAATVTELLWGIEEAVSCRAVGAVVADIAQTPKSLDFTASRRLNLRSETTGNSVFLVRYGLTREASAARRRWRVEPVLSGAPPFDARAPGRPRWQVEIERGRSGESTEGKVFLLDWTENGFVSVGDTSNTSVDSSPAPSRVALAALGNRLSQAS